MHQTAVILPLGRRARGRQRHRQVAGRAARARERERCGVARAFRRCRVGAGDGHCRCGRRGRVIDDDGDGGCRGLIPGRVPRHRSQGMRAVGSGRRVPIHAVSRAGVFAAQIGAVQLELHARHADVI